MDTTLGIDPLTRGDYQNFPSIIYNNLSYKPWLLSSIYQRWCPNLNVQYWRYSSRCNVVINFDAIILYAVVQWQLNPVTFCPSKVLSPEKDVSTRVNNAISEFGRSVLILMTCIPMSVLSLMYACVWPQKCFVVSYALGVSKKYYVDRSLWMVICLKNNHLLPETDDHGPWETMTKGKMK